MHRPFGTLMKFLLFQNYYFTPILKRGGGVWGKGGARMFQHKLGSAANVSLPAHLYTNMESGGGRWEEVISRPETGTIAPFLDSFPIVVPC